MFYNIPTRGVSPSSINRPWQENTRGARLGAHPVFSPLLRTWQLRGLGKLRPRNDFFSPRRDYTSLNPGIIPRPSGPRSDSYACSRCTLSVAILLPFPSRRTPLPPLHSSRRRPRFRHPEAGGARRISFRTPPVRCGNAAPYSHVYVWTSKDHPRAWKASTVACILRFSVATFFTRRLSLFVVIVSLPRS